MGSDLSVVNAARVSFAKESEWEQEMSDGPPQLTVKDQKLISYLAKHNHWSPFAHNSLTFRIKAPIFVARQLVKHQVGGVWNEVSRRYVDDEPEFYLPALWHKAPTNAKQGASEEEMTPIFEQGYCLFCGTKFTATNNRQKYCCKAHQSQHYNQLHPFETKLTRWKASAKARGLAWDITEKDLEWPLHCPYMGSKLNYLSDDKADNVASLDRINSNFGYIPGNVQIISSLANKMKNNASSQNLITFAKNVLMLHGGYIIPEKSGVEQFYETCLEGYKTMIAQGMAPEEARMFLPVSQMTEWWWTGSLMFFARVCKQRLDSHAQSATRDIAKMISEQVPQEFQHSWKALMT